ncbi:MAG TPA: serine/threonine-protein kinase, partial [Herpetosiphonaceae bacterium]
MTTIGNRYDIQRVLGQGGMATVYAARDLQLERDVALKVLRPDVNASGDTLAQFQREARIAAGFNHPHIARVYDVGDDPRYGPYFVQELVPGGLLATMLPVKPEQALRWTRQIATALDTIHGQGFIHCDVKPHNVQITPEQGALLLDFGVAEAAGAECELIRGTPLYLAPERLYGHPPAPAADVFALGVMLYEMLAGSVPVPSETGERQWLPLNESNLPAGAPAIEALLAGMTAADPAARPAMAEVAERLAAILKQSDAPTAAQPIIAQRQTVPIANMATDAVPPAASPAG